MKAKLEFNLPEDRDEFRLATDGYKWFSLAFEISSWLRSMVKYEAASSGEAVHYEIVREKLFEFMETQGISLEDVQ